MGSMSSSPLVLRNLANELDTVQHKSPKKLEFLQAEMTGTARRTQALLVCIQHMGQRSDAIEETLDTKLSEKDQTIRFLNRKLHEQTLEAADHAAALASVEANLSELQSKNRVQAHELSELAKSRKAADLQIQLAEERARELQAQLDAQREACDILKAEKETHVAAALAKQSDDAGRIARLEALLRERDAAIAEMAKETEYAKLESEAYSSDCARRMQETEQQLAAKDARIVELQETVSTVQDEQATERERVVALNEEVVGLKAMIKTLEEASKFAADSATTVQL